MSVEQVHSTTGLVDVHTHAIDPALPDLSSDYPGSWPSVRPTGDGRAHVRVGGEPYRRVDDRCWSAEHRLADMDAAGVAVQVISPMPVTLMHGADPAGAAVLARAQNDFLADLVSQAPERLLAFGVVPLQDPESAVAELRRCRDLGFLGIEIGTRVGERSIADEDFDPVFAAAAELNAIVFVHPVDADVDPRLTRLGLGFGAGMPTETGIAAASLIEQRVVQRRPGVRLLLAHGGGTLPWLLPRLDRGERLHRPDDTDVAGLRARGLYCDSLVYDPTQVRLIADRIGADHVLLGTDYPFPARERLPGAVLAELPDLRRAVGAENALQLFATAKPTSPTYPPKGKPWATSSALA